MNEDKESSCIEEGDYVNHMLIEQITRICVLEEEERIKDEMAKNHDKQ
ncbi:hypothetical protein KDJ21_020495 [Metabacillus litoralis]|nr:hypothetical protein [Metabacillus litoralis]MCM3161373.1 hypothetical protein [Metabacillus litoralis]MCM3409223.1 hypothetical protein [Metabacillus litoralis]UHA59161.1 hypothetical protein KDJ21_020495 [Metabacillus litoralis]